MKQKLFDFVPEGECAERQCRPYSLKWVLKNLGEGVRAPLGVREIKKSTTEDEKLEPCDVFSAKPPVESLTALVSHVMTERVGRRGRNLVLEVFDVPKPHFYGVCERDVYVEPPSELHRPGFVGKLNKTMYGPQDASSAWQKLWVEHLRNGCELGASNPALYRSELLNGFCHGDDFVIAPAKGIRSKTDRHDRCSKELEVLHRSVRVINSEMMEIQTDQCSAVDGRSRTHSRQHGQDSEGEAEGNRYRSN